MTRRANGKRPVRRNAKLTRGFCPSLPVIFSSVSTEVLLLLFSSLRRLNSLKPPPSAGSFWVTPPRETNLSDAAHGLPLGLLAFRPILKSGFSSFKARCFLKSIISVYPIFFELHRLPYLASQNSLSPLDKTVRDNGAVVAYEEAQQARTIRTKDRSRPIGAISPDAFHVTPSGKARTPRAAPDAQMAWHASCYLKPQ